MANPSGGRPEWLRTIGGTPIEVVACVKAEDSPTSRQSMLVNRQRIMLVRPGAVQPKPEDQFDVQYCFGPESTPEDVLKHTVQPLLDKLVEGYNTSIVTLGATGSGKTSLLEGTRGFGAGDSSGPRPPAQDSASSLGNGLVQLGIDYVFHLLHSKAKKVGMKLAERRRGTSSKPFDFFVESSFVEIFMENVTDLYCGGQARGASLPVVEDAQQGWHAQAATWRIAKSAEELRADFNEGRHARNMSQSDVGRAHERTAALFCVRLSQIIPGGNHLEEDRILTSRLLFVDTPGSERLSMDPELLRLREGLELNRALLSLASVLRSLADVQNGSSTSQFVNYEGSVLTKLLSETLGGNCLCCFIGMLRQGDFEHSRAALEHLMAAQQGRNFPVVNHNRASGLLFNLRQRLMTIQAERQALRSQLESVPTEVNAEEIAIVVAKLRDLEATVLEEREEKAALAAEKGALNDRLRRLLHAGEEAEVEKEKLYNTLIQSEEERLTVSRALIEFQLEHNEKVSALETERHSLEERILLLEGKLAELRMQQSNAASLEEERDEAQNQLTETTMTLDGAQKRIMALKDRVRAGERELAEARSAWDEEKHALREAMADEIRVLKDDKTALNREIQELRGGVSAENVSSLKELVRKKERRVEEVESELAQVLQESSVLQRDLTVAKVDAEKSREDYYRRLRGLVTQLDDLARSANLASADPQSALAPGPEAFEQQLRSLRAELEDVHRRREQEALMQLDALQQRHAMLRSKFRALFLGYRSLRYHVESTQPLGQSPVQVLHEDDLVGQEPEILYKEDEAAEDRMLDSIKPRADELGVYGRRPQRAEVAMAQPIRVTRVVSAHAAGEPLPRELESLSLENERLRTELDGLRKGVGTPIGQLKEENAYLKAKLAVLGSQDRDREKLSEELVVAQQENARLHHTLLQSGSPMAIRKQVREFTLNTQVQLEQQLAQERSRLVMAEEQLAQLQDYLSRSTVMYQKEIMRLRNLVMQLDPQALKEAPPLRSPEKAGPKDGDGS